jgi:hypothetical protein
MKIVRSFLKNATLETKGQGNDRNLVPKKVNIQLISFKSCSFVICQFKGYVHYGFFAENSNDEAESAVKRPNQRKIKANPNVHVTSKIQKKRDAEKENGSSSDDEIMVSYKSKRSAMAAGPADQGATGDSSEY